MALTFPGCAGCVSAASGGRSEEVWQCMVCGVGGCVAVLVAGLSIYPLPHASGVVAVEVLLYVLLVPALVLIDASPQASLFLVRKFTYL